MGISYSPEGYAMHANHLAMQHQQQFTMDICSHSKSYNSFIHTVEDLEAAAIVEDDEEEDLGNFVIPEGICNNWAAVDVPTVIHKST
ncbi:hypothetical protein KIW84_073418 [Lathyrus oleraceus]|uniref:Uncharacterized protein n=1 Tax=Pisum sativum TaxID=3888 RepID=A0A9D4ZXC1_PEA|nr:hypothetical protein KIW84_073418 [Pisum sativum]